jgi:predicted nuclease of predicted toxin-antitoxin system
MQQLFIELFLDEDVEVLLAQLVRGFSVVTTREAGRLGATDEQQLAYAASQHWVLLTHNRADFESLHQAFVASSREHPGIMIAARRSPYEVARRLLLILNHVAADELQNQLRYI